MEDTILTIEPVGMPGKNLEFYVPVHEREIIIELDRAYGSRVEHDGYVIVDIDNPMNLDISCHMSVERINNEYFNFLETP